ncbi:MAG: glycosyltransferase [Planctomycetes bacterium]|nr:glycosyltransferase [Planctomycetota bacterium]
MKIEFYHVDAFEAVHYEPIWRALCAAGVDARLVAIPGSDNTAQEGWFDFERLKSCYDSRHIPFSTTSDYDCSAITTQNESVLRHYKSLHIRLPYGPVVYPESWGLSEKPARPFDALLVHGQFYFEYFSQWKSKDEMSIIGYPYYDDFFAGKINTSQCSSKWCLDKSKQTIVYLPTWEGRSSIDAFLDQISSLTSEFNVLVKPHHCTLRMEPERMARIARSGLTLVESAYALPALFSVADLVIADTRSGAFFESIMTDTTTIGLAPNRAEIQEWLEPKGVTQLGPICTDPTTLKTAVGKLFENDFYKSARQQWADKHVSFRDGSAAKHAADEIIKLVERKQDNETSKASQISVPVDIGKKKLDFERKKRNIFWICIDGLMAGKLNCCGNTKRPKLFVDELLSRGALFSKVYTAGAGTQTSMHAAFTSMQSASSGTVGWTQEALDKIDPNTLSLTDFLKRDGYHTFHYCDGVTPQVVPKSGFDVWETSGYHVGQIIKNTSPTMDCQKRDEFIDQYNQQKSPKFAYLHMHLLHDLNIAFGDIWPTEGYEHNITLLSESLEQLLQKIKINDDDLLIVSTDHGVILDKLYVEYERQAGPRHEEVSNQAFYSFINKDLTRCFTDRLFATIDIAPTILDIIGAGPMGAQGQSLLPFMLGDTAGYKPAMVFREKGAAYDTPPSPDESNLWCVRTERWKYVTHKWRKDCEWLMDLQNDGDYKKNLIGQGLEIEDILRKAVHERLIDNPKKPLEIYAENKLEFSRSEIKPVISIVMPVEVATPWLSKSIDSLLTQVGPYYELIILDAEETNYTEQTVLNKYSGRPNVHYHRLEQHLLFELLNFGIESAGGDYIALASPQACYEDDFIYELKKRLDSNKGIGLAYSDGKVVREDDCVNGNDTVEDSKLELWNAPKEFVPSVLFRINLMKKTGLFIKEENLYQQMWKRMAKVTHFAYVPQFSAQYYRIEGQAMGEKLQAQKANPKVSVVLPTYNHLKFLPKAIDSVLSQTYGDFELIIVNDGSTDGTAEYLDALEDPRIRVIHQENKRLPEALNTGFRGAKGEYLTWISSDNYCVPIYLEAFVAALDANPDAGFAYSAYAVIDEDGQYKDNRERFDVSLHNLFTHNAGTASFMYRRICQEKVGLYDPEVEGAEDWDMWLRIVEQFQTVYIPEVLYYYREHKESMTQKIPEEIHRAGQRVFQKALNRHNNKLDMMKLYPMISLCKDQKQARFDACFDFGINILMWKFARAELACQMFENALSLFPDSMETACNLAIAYARLGLQEKVVTLKQAMAEKTDDPKIQDFWHNIIEACHANNPDIFTRKFLFIIDKKLVELFQLEEKNKRVFNFTGNAQPKRAALSKGNDSIELKKQKYVVTLLGYTDPEHTNWYPWKMFHRVFEELGYSSQWVEVDDIAPTSSQRRIFICWNEPDAKTLISLGKIRPGDVVLQKLTSLGKGYGDVNWGNDALGFFKNWTWPIYKDVENLYDSGVNIYAFGCRTNTSLFPEKHRICEKLKGRIHWIPWGSSLYSWEEIQNAKPVISDFRSDIGFIGSVWGKTGRGNVDVVRDFLEPLMPGRKCVLAGKGTEQGPVDDERHKEILRRSKLCPIINAASWKAERGIQDRFWTVFTTGRFGIVDSEGIYDFFDEDEVVCETEPAEYVLKSMYYMENVEKQLPYIEKVQARIKKEYNYYVTWNNLLSSIISEQ